MIVPENIEACITLASKDKRNRASIKRICEDPTKVIEKTIYELENDLWEPETHNKIKLREGAHRKEREVQKPKFNNEQIVHHMLMG